MNGAATLKTDVSSKKEKDILTRVAEIIDAKHAVNEKESAFIRKLKADGFNPIAVFQASKFYQILKKLNFFWFENLDKEDRVPGWPQFNAKLSTSISRAFVVLGIVFYTAVASLMEKGIIVPVLAVTALSASFLWYNACLSRKQDDAVEFIPWLILVAAGACQIAPSDIFQELSFSNVGKFFMWGILYLLGVGAIHTAAHALMVHKRFCGYLATQINSRLPMRKLIEKLFPHKNDANGSSDLKVKLYFNADDLFNETKKKLWSGGYNPCIASPWQGFIVDRKELRGVYEKREHEFPSAYDPVLFLVSPDKKEIAAMARCGRFPDDQALLKLAKEI